MDLWKRLGVKIKYLEVEAVMQRLLPNKKEARVSFKIERIKPCPLMLTTRRKFAKLKPKADLFNDSDSEDSIFTIESDSKK